MAPFPANVIAHPGLAADVDSIVATVATGLAIERDRRLQAGLAQIDGREGRSGLFLELSPNRGVIEITADHGVIAHRGRDSATTALELIYTEHSQLGAAIKRGQANAMSSAFAVVRPFLIPDRFPTRREFSALQKWAPLIEKSAYKIAAGCAMLLDANRRYALSSEEAPRPAKPLSSYFGGLHALGHLTLIASSSEAQDWLSDMALAFTWVNWTPSFALVRERTAWLAAAAARSAAAFGPAVVPRYFQALENARHAIKVFDALLGLVAIACAHGEAFGPVQEGITRRQRDATRRVIPGQLYANLAYESALSSLKAWERKQENPTDIGQQAWWPMKSDPDLTARQALWIDPTDAGPNGDMFGIAMLPSIMSVNTEQHYPMWSVKAPSQGMMHKVLQRAWAPAANGLSTLH